MPTILCSPEIRRYAFDVIYALTQPFLRLLLIEKTKWFILLQFAAEHFTVCPVNVQFTIQFVSAESGLATIAGIRN